VRPLLQAILRRSNADSHLWLSLDRAVLRLILLLLTSRPLLSPPLPSPSLDPALFAIPPSGSTKAPTDSAASGRPKDPIREILLPKTLFAGSLTPGRELVRALSPRGMLGEALHSVRGLIYVLMLRTRSSSLPVILSLLMALASRALLRGRAAVGRKGKEREGAKVALGSLERDEFARRDRALGGLLFRGVVWDGMTRCVSPL
jgi:peroxin-16